MTVENWLQNLPEDVMEEVLQINDPKIIKLLVGLNASQVRAALSIDGPIQIDAVPGSGKTHTLVRRIANMIHQGVKPKSIMLTTFTKKASEEMVDRLKPLVPSMALMQMTIGTTHSIGWKILSKEYKNMNHPLAGAFTRNANKFLINGKLKIFADKTKKAIMQDRTVSFDVKQELRDIPIPALLKVIGHAKNEGKDHQDFISDHPGNNAKSEAYCEFFERYENDKWSQCLVDADDLLFLMWKLFKEHPAILEKYRNIYKYILVDEAQDSNSLQYEVVRMLAYPENNIFLVGDTDQCMYSFRGARPEEFIGFSSNFSRSKRIPLEDNYRSNPHILKVADSLIKNNTSRMDKTLRAHKQNDEDCVTFNEYRSEMQEAKSVVSDIKINMDKNGVAPKDMAVLYRTNAQSRAIEEQLIIEGVPYVIHGGISFYERKEVKDLIAYMQLTLDPHNDKALDRVINVPSRYLGKVFKERMKACNSSYWDAIHGGFRMESYMERGANEFIGLVEKLQRKVKEGCTPVELVEFMMEDFYTEYLKEEGDEEDDNSSRFENIETLKFALEQYEDVQSFLDYIDLMNSKAKHSIDGVQLMTIHKSKGLEFKYVYGIGLCQGILPHFKSIEACQNGRPMAIEEERRLLYVLITRAELECHLSSPGSFNGKQAPVSMFVNELGLDERKYSTDIIEDDTEDMVG